jgi:hypothetical protein
MVTTLINLAPPYIQGTIIDEVIQPRRDLSSFMALAQRLFGCL